MKLFVKILIVAVGLFILDCLLHPIFGQEELTSKPLDRTRKEATHLISGLHAYHHEYGTYPAGNTSALCRSLSGENPKKIVFFETAPKGVLPDGSFVDPWGTPYQIFLFDDAILIWSAGPDKVFADGYVRDSDDFIASSRRK